MNSALVGTGRLIRAMLRADRVRLPIWLLVIIAFIGYVAVIFPQVMDEEGIAARAAVMSEPAGAMMAGPGYGLENYTLEVLMANEMLGMFAVVVALMSLGLVVRHTRAEEESGRAELVRAAPVGRYAHLTGAVIVLLVANLVVGVGTALALIAAGLSPALDAWSFGAALAGVGLVFGGIAATTSQLSSHARVASGMAGVALGAAYVLRAVGDAQERGGSVLSWLSPIGWAQQMRIYVDLRWWPFLLLLGLAALGIGVGYVLLSRRDVGAGMLPEKRGRATATPAGRTLVGITARLERGRVIWWAVGLMVFGVLTGSLAGPISEAFASNDQLLLALGVNPENEAAMANLVVEMMGTFLKLFAMAVTVFAVMSARQLRSDEANNRSELVLAGAVSRVRWLGAPMIVNALGVVLLLAASGLGLGLGTSTELGGSAVGDFVLASLTYAPLVICFLAASMLFYGMGRGNVVLWIVIAVLFVVGMYGTMMGLPDELLDVEPFGMVEPIGLVRGGEGDWAPVIWAGIMAVVVGVGALFIFRRRDLKLT